MIPGGICSSRMRSEGFPFIVGVWGWTCVRVVFVVSSSSGLRRVLVGSLISLLWAVHTLRHNHVLQKMKSGEVSHEMLVLALQSLQMGGHFHVLRGGRNTLEACLYQRVTLAWQAQHVAPWRVAFAWQAQHFVTCWKYFFHESHWQGCANMTQWQKSWRAQHLVTALKTCGRLAKSNTFGGLWK